MSAHALNAPNQAPLWSVAACYVVAALAWLAIDPATTIEGV